MESKQIYPPATSKRHRFPEGFPPPSEPGKVVEKTYPVLRSYSATGPGSFMKCFGYLSVKQHKMTAPVVMECKPGVDPSKRLPGDDMPVPIERMHFLLEKNSLDAPKVGARSKSPTCQQCACSALHSGVIRLRRR